MNLKNIELVNFLDLSLDEKLELLEWRNTKSISMWMYDSENISEEKHFKFIESLIDDLSKKYFLVKDNGLKIGVIYFTDIQINMKSAEFGLYSNPKLKGIGKLLMKIILNYGFSTLNLNILYAEVFSNNVKAFKLYLDNGLKQFKTEMINNKEIIFMEIKNETR